MYGKIFSTLKTIMNLINGNQTSLLAANCRGLNNKEKQYDIINYIKEARINIACLQDTHLVKSMESVIKNDWDGEVFLSGSRSNARRVAILISKNFEYKVFKIEKDNEGNLLVMDLEIEDSKFRIINIYGSNTDDIDFHQKVKSKVGDNEEDHLVICGDFNMTLNRNLDSQNYLNWNNPRARLTVLDIVEEYGLIDLLQILQPK